MIDPDALLAEGARLVRRYEAVGDDDTDLIRRLLARLAQITKELERANLDHQETRGTVAALKQELQRVGHREVTPAEHAPWAGRAHGNCFSCGLLWPCPTVQTESQFAQITEERDTLSREMAIVKKVVAESCDECKRPIYNGEHSVMNDSSDPRDWHTWCLLRIMQKRAEQAEADLARLQAAAEQVIAEMRERAERFKAASREANHAGNQEMDAYRDGQYMEAIEWMDRLSTLIR